MVHQVTDTYFVSPQITPEAMAQLAEHGFSDVICNRPDSEIGPELQHDVMEQAAKAAGLVFHFHPLVHQSLLETSNSERQRDILAGAEGKVLAYCASGNRSSVVWALGQAGVLPADQIIDAAAGAGYDLSQLRPMLG